MKRIRRRDFLTAAGAAGAAALLPSRARAQVGSLTPNSAIGGHTLPDVGLGYPGYQVLEVFLYGGMAPWDSFYVIDNAAMRTADSAIRTRLTGCTSPTPTARDFAGSGSTLVRWGMVMADLFPVIGQARVVVHSHDAPVHEIGVPYALTGHNLGNPRQAGLGAAIHRRFREVNGTSTIPRAFTLGKRTGSTGGVNIATIASSGAHGNVNRPVHIEATRAFDFTDFGRAGHEVKDDYVAALRARYAEPLRFAGARVRSPALDGLETVYNYVRGAASMRGVLSARGGVVPAPLCGTPPAASDAFVAGEALNIACHLLATNHTDGRPVAAYAGVIDAGARDVLAGTGYDAHFLSTEAGHLDTQTVNLRSTLKHLRDRIDGAGGGPRLDLNKTIVVITTEFGRPFAGGSRNGHMNDGYCSLVFGGPYTRTAGATGLSPARGTAGVLNRSTGIAPLVYPGTGLSTHPRTLRASLLMSAGIDPVDAVNVYTRDELMPAGASIPSDSELRTSLGRDVLGFL